jgi:hypothetical protein
MTSATSRRGAAAKKEKLLHAKAALQAHGGDSQALAPHPHVRHDHSSVWCAFIISHARAARQSHLRKKD